MKFGLKIGALALFAMANVANADDSMLREELMDLKAKVASLETAEMAPAAGGDCTTLTSMKKKGCIQIGGNVEMDIQAISRDERGALDTGDIDDGMNGPNDDFSYTRFASSDADLDFKIMADNCTYLWIKLDLDDMSNGAQADDILEEVYFKWMNVRGSNIDVRLGKGEVPYGQDKDVAITDSYHHNSGTGSYLATNFNRLSGDAKDAAVGNRFHPGEVDNAFMIEGTYTWKDLLKFEAALFQNPAARNMHEDRSEDNLFFESYCARVTYTPLENLTLKASYINLHDESNNDNNNVGADTVTGVPLTGVNGTSNQRAFSVAFDYKTKCLPLEIFGEYQHGWAINHEEDYVCNVAQLGAIYGLTENIALVGIGEWMGIHADSSDLGVAAGVADKSCGEDYYKAAAAGKYTFDNGIYMMLEYAHEWHNQEGGYNGENREADVVSFRTAWSF